MRNHWFKLKLPENILRQMNKKEYKAAMSWLRYCRREIEKLVNFNQLISNMTGWPVETL